MALKGTIQDLYNFLTTLWTVSDTHAHAAKAALSTNHMQHIKRLITCNMQNVSYLFWQSWNCIHLKFYFIWLKQLIDEWRGESQDLKKNEKEKYDQL